MIKLFSSLDMTLFERVKQALGQNQIPFIVKGDGFIGAAAGEVPPVVCWPEIWVGNENDWQTGQKLVKSLNFTVIDSRPWHCKQCGEVLEPQFSLCWNCGSQKPNSHELQSS